ncbi:MAG TPA: response regulator transcription factor [Chthoniobacteraceae bacterium]|jgi:DNA-binding response OmpR family regulator|nr:response regulator transcription factor [Chthoniobacteraceae bacterium]
MTPETNRILIAEDHYVSRHLLERNLTNWGFEVITAEDGDAAVRVLESADAPPLAIVDWMMPKLDGLEVCRRIREKKDRPYIYLVLLTAKSHKEEIATGLEAGADDYVIKPFDPDELRARLKVGQRVVELERQLAKRVTDLEQALADVKKLRRLLPICMYCKSVRDDKDYWHEIEEYIHTETGADFSHGICPNCMGKLHETGSLM